jgi:hypothetical protein
MPIFLLKIKADLENIETLRPVEGVCWKFDIESSDGERKEGITVSSTEIIELEGSRGEANFVMRWHKGDPPSYIKIVAVKKVDGSYNSKDGGKFATIAGFECRGLTITRYIPGEDFSATSSGGTVFEGVDLTEGDWAEYDDSNGNDLSVSITNFESKIESS